MDKLDIQFLDQMISNGKAVIRDAVARSDKPLVIQFSGGKDSMAMAGLVREVTDNYVLSFMRTDIEFNEAVEFARQSATLLGRELIISNPAEHLGGFFERLAKFRRFPTVRAQWCNRDLKVRPQQKMLRRLYGKGVFYKLVGVRRYESIRRRHLYSRGVYIRADNQVSGDQNVYPILDWTNQDILNYLHLEGLPTSSLYKKYGVSGCYWCPFYQESIYMKILADYPNLYDEFIKWENILDKPSVNGELYIRDIKNKTKYSYQNV